MEKLIKEQYIRLTKEQVKDAESGEWIIEHFIPINFGVPDKSGDIYEKGCFTPTDSDQETSCPNP
jgi:hypothetical protein